MQFRAKKEILFTPLRDNTGVILRLSDTFFFSLNETGVSIWRAIERGMDFNSIVRAIREEFDVEEDVAREDVKRFIDELKKEGIIEDAIS